MRLIPMLKKSVLAGLLILAAGLAWGQQMAITFDDLPVHGALPLGMTRLEIAHSILETLNRERLPPVYGLINGGRGAEDPNSLSVLQAWRMAGQPLGNHTWAQSAWTSRTIFGTNLTRGVWRSMMRRRSPSCTIAIWRWRISTTVFSESSRSWFTVGT